MNNQFNETIALNDEEKTVAQQNRVLTDAFALQVAEQVLNNIERLLLKVVPQNYDLSKIKESLDEYKKACAEDSESVPKIEFRLLQELQFWRLTLARRDEKVKAFHLRRYYDANASSLTPKMLAGLACFYRSLMPTFEIRSKYDFVITQLFSNKLPGKPRFVRIGQADLIERLKKFNYAWTGIESNWLNADESNRREDAVAVFESLRRELNNYNRLEDLLKSGFFKRVLRHKQYLGENFYAPEVTAASIQYNVAVGNKFTHLVSAENLQFQDLLKAEHGDIEVVNMMLEENPSHSKTLLKQINPEFNDSEEEAENFQNDESETEAAHNEVNETLEPKAEQFAVSEEFEKINRAEHAAEPFGEGTSKRETSESDFVENNPELEAQNYEADSEKINFLQVLSELNKQKPDKKLLQEYLTESSEEDVRGFDLLYYLEINQDITEREHNLKRQALRLIFIAEEYWRRIKGVSTELLLSEDVTVLVEEMQTVSKELRTSINVLFGENKRERSNVLLTISNGLLEARLRLDSAFSKTPNLESSKRAKDLSKTSEKFLAEIRKKQTEDDQPETEEPAAITPIEVEQQKIEPYLNRWLIAATCLTILFGGIYHLNSTFAVQTDTDPEIAQTADAKDINVKMLRGGEQLLVAKVNNRTLIGAVNEDWKSIAEEKKQENLRLLLEQGNVHQFETVLLFNSKGDIVGNATKQEIKVK